MGWCSHLCAEEVGHNHARHCCLQTAEPQPMCSSIHPSARRARHNNCRVGARPLRRRTARTAASHTGLAVDSAPTGARTPARPACCGTPATARPRAGQRRRGRCRWRCCRARLRGMRCTASAAAARLRPERRAGPQPRPRPRPAPAARPCSQARGRAPPAATPHPVSVASHVRCRRSNALRKENGSSKAARQRRTLCRRGTSYMAGFCGEQVTEAACLLAPACLIVASSTTPTVTQNLEHRFRNAFGNPTPQQALGEFALSKLASPRPARLQLMQAHASPAEPARPLSLPSPRAWPAQAQNPWL